MPDNINYVTVSALNFYLNRIIGAEELLQGILLMGEVSGAKTSGANLYFDVKDEGAQIAAVCFNVAKTYRPSNGEKVLLRGSPNYYQKGGKLSFIASTIQPFGLGALYAELEKRKAKLTEEGIFAEERKKPLPSFIRSMGIVTSINGAVISDIVSTIRKKNLLIDITVIDVKVQGEGAAQDMCKALRLADTQGFDVVVLARGGGSFEDLMPFNDENLARTLYGMNTVTISAVGHETDYSISDMAADVRALTPTAAAEMLAYDPSELMDSIIDKVGRAGERIGVKLDNLSAHASYSASVISGAADSALSDASYKVKELIIHANNKIRGVFDDKQRKIDILFSSLSALNPARLLEKGYFKVSLNGTDIAGVSDLSEGQTVTLHSADGRAEAEIKKIQLIKEVKQ